MPTSVSSSNSSDGQMQGVVRLELHRAMGVVLLDEADLPLVADRKWYLGDSGYAASVHVRGGRRRNLLMHRLLLGILDQPSVFGDHINGQNLDNRRSNLRRCTQSQNNANWHRSRGGSSQFRGVYWSAQSRKWIAQVKLHGDQRYLGSFKNEVDAALAYDTAAREVFGEFARPNFGCDALSRT